MDKIKIEIDRDVHKRLMALKVSQDKKSLSDVIRGMTLEHKEEWTKITY